MSVTPGTQSSEQIQIGVTLLERFLECTPQYFQAGPDGKLHHDPRKVNVFAHGRKIFADSYGGELTMDDPSEFAMVKHRLLTQPTFLQVTLKKEKKSGNTRYITRGNFVIFLNNTHPFIQQQLREKLDQCEQLLSADKNFALEIDLGPALKAWYKTRFAHISGSYSADGSNFCITNFSQKCHECYNPILWIGCLPFMLLFGPPYCIYRAAKVNDLDCPVRANVTYLEGVSAAERHQLAVMLAQAYVQGLNAGTAVQSTPNLPPPYTDNPPPPAYGQI
uniref:Uncharacterized protein LOC100181832 n=1 Tax=Phallusia mammillata TaxID=59560 RepID=A0A6F9DGU2_9ASCI|nr:uncharacterized protein LOC100181832 [Phallusia mammillata]